MFEARESIHGRDIGTTVYRTTFENRRTACGDLSGSSMPDDPQGVPVFLYLN